MEPTGIEKLVCEDIAARQKLGIQKYGVTVMESNEIGLLPWLKHAYTECLESGRLPEKAIHELETGKH